MNFEIFYHDSVVRADIPALDTIVKKQIKLTIEKKLATYPEIFGKPLRQSLKGYRKLRVGDYRVIFKIEGKKVKIFVIGHRSIVYGIAADRHS